MEENKNVQVPEEKSPVVRPKAEAVVKEPAGLPLEVKPAADTASEVSAADAGNVQECPPEPQTKTSSEETATPKHTVVSVESPAAEVEVEVVDDRDKQADELIHWGAARAGVIVLTPVLGTAALIANEVYMISRIGSIYGENVTHKSVLAFMGSLGGTVLGNLAATLIPLPFMQMPIAVSVTFGIGKAAQRWIKDGQPDNIKPYIDIFEMEKAEGKASAEALENNPGKDIPLGDEKADFTQELKRNIKKFYPVKAHRLFNTLTDNLEGAVSDVADKAEETLRRAGVTDEQMDSAKYTAMAAREVTEETVDQVSRDVKIAARIKAKELSRDAVIKARLLKEQAELKVELMKARADALKAQAMVKEIEARVRAKQAKAAALEQMEAARKQAEGLRDEVKRRTDAAQAKAEEVSGKIKNSASEAEENIRQAASDFRSRVEEKAAYYREQDKAEQARAGKAEPEETTAPEDQKGEDKE